MTAQTWALALQRRCGALDAANTAAAAKPTPANADRLRVAAVELRGFLEREPGPWLDVSLLGRELATLMERLATGDGDPRALAPEIVVKAQSFKVALERVRDQ